MSAVRRLGPPDTTITVGGQPVPARVGETLAAALLASDGWRPFYCGMGVCFTCVVTVDSVAGRRACLELVRPDMRVELGGWEDVLRERS